MPVDTITQYIEELKKGKDTAERLFNQRKALLNRATAANDKTQVLETTWKEYNDAVVATDKTAQSIDDSLLRAAKIGDDVAKKTSDAEKAVSLLGYEVRDIACQAEKVASMLTDFRKAVEAKLGKDAPALTCIDDVSKTVPAVVTIALDAVDKTAAVSKTINEVHAAIAANCGVNTRLLKLLTYLKDCGFKDKVDPNSDAAKLEKALQGKYNCTIPDANMIVDNKCGTLYIAYTNPTTDIVCNRTFNASFSGYRTSVDNNYTKVQAKSKAARAWFNCTAEAKNAAESDFNACKAAYEAAVAAKKC